MPNKPTTRVLVMDERALRQRLLTAPVVSLILQLAWPVIVVLLLQTLVGIAETFYVSFLGTNALAGVALVFPVVMLMTMMSSGGIGGGVSSAVARAIGAGRSVDANALVLHALVLAVVFGMAFTIGVLGTAPILYRALGGNGRVLDVALTYSKIIITIHIGAAPINTNSSPPRCAARAMLEPRRSSPSPEPSC